MNDLLDKEIARIAIKHADIHNTDLTRGVTTVIHLALSELAEFVVKQAAEVAEGDYKGGPLTYTRRLIRDNIISLGKVKK